MHVLVLTSNFARPLSIQSHFLLWLDGHWLARLGDTSSLRYTTSATPLLHLSAAPPLLCHYPGGGSPPALRRSAMPVPLYVTPCATPSAMWCVTSPLVSAWADVVVSAYIYCITAIFAQGLDPVSSIIKPTSGTSPGLPLFWLCVFSFIKLEYWALVGHISSMHVY